MRAAFLPLRLFLGLLSFFCVLSTELAAAPPPAGTRVTVPATGLSYVPPPGWRANSSTGMDNKFCHASFVNGFEANFTIGVRASPDSTERILQDKAAEIIDNTPSLHVLSRQPFVTASGLRGGRILLDVKKPGAPKARRTLLYVLGASHFRKIIVITDSLSADGSKNDATLDACVKTFTVK